MKSTQTLNFVRFTACMVLVVGLSVSASASCGDSLLAMGTGAASVQNQSRPMQQNSETARGTASKASIVGLWHTQFIVGDQTIQDAYQIWNVGGTEGHNANEVSFQEALIHARDSEAQVEYDKTTGNPHYDYYEEDDSHHIVWFLDGVTAFNQMRAASGYHPAGFGLWRLGSEDP